MLHEYETKYLLAVLLPKKTSKLAEMREGQSSWWNKFGTIALR